jgi:hypothetical protein
VSTTVGAGAKSRWLGRGAEGDRRKERVTLLLVDARGCGSVLNTTRSGLARTKGCGSLSAGEDERDILAQGGKGAVSAREEDGWRVKYGERGVKSERRNDFLFLLCLGGAE